VLKTVVLYEEINTIRYVSSNELVNIVRIKTSKKNNICFFKRVSECYKDNNRSKNNICFFKRVSECCKDNNRSKTIRCFFKRVSECCKDKTEVKTIICFFKRVSECYKDNNRSKKIGIISSNELVNVVRIKQK
jgi:hypothetical protein